MRRILATLICFGTLAPLARADETTLRSVAVESSSGIDEPSGKESVDDLVAEAQTLLAIGNPIEARSKLLKALQLAPRDYRPQMMLGAYYLAEVGHFRLALKYLRTAEENFQRDYGTDEEIGQNPEKWKEHARLLYYLAEARLNLDNYDGALTTLDRFGERYWDDWYPGTRAWILMKLKRLDEAIITAQAGLLRGAELGRTYNILGILLSLKDNRDLALDAFGKAIKAEMALGSLGQPATPLNNAGEVYREIFSDDLSEAAYIRAISLQDGCEHILPSLNLSILLVDQLRLLQADRTLDDFVACFSQNRERSDTEHRSLLALQRGRIARHEGDTAGAVKQLGMAIEREQWFGKIGTNENDVRFATSVSYANALEAHAAALRDRVAPSLTTSARQSLEMEALRIRAWWYRRKAREIALTELDDFEDLHIRNTDTMIEYPTLGRLTAGFPTRALELRLDRLKATDPRAGARPYYDLFEGVNLLSHGESELGIKLLETTLAKFREIDRLARAEALAALIRAYSARSRGMSSWFSSTKASDRLKSIELTNELFSLLPAHVRNQDLTLPVRIDHGTSTDTSTGDTLSLERQLESVKSDLLQTRFGTLQGPEVSLAKYSILLSGTVVKSGEFQVELSLKELATNNLVAKSSDTLDRDPAKRAALLNSFITKVFSHRSDPLAAPTPALEILKSGEERDF